MGDFWQDKFWHHRVHEQRLGEMLVYYLCRVRPFEPEKVKDNLRAVLSEQKLGSIRAFPIFGTYDLLIRAWLHPTFAASFRSALDSGIAGPVYHTSILSVERIHRRWYDQEPVLNTDLLDTLDEETIRAVQAGTREELFDSLRQNRLIIERKSSVKKSAIHFFVAINLEDKTTTHLAKVTNEINKYIEKKKSIKYASIYTGHGFCAMLFKGQVQNFFKIGEFTNWIALEFKSFGVSTETYLVHGPTPLIGTEEISEATFRGLKGRDLFAQSIIPDLYSGSFSNRQVEKVQSFLDKEAKDKQLTVQDRNLLKRCLHGYLTNQPTEIAQALFTFFYEVESYLRENCKEFITRKAPGRHKEMYQMADIEIGKKFPSLGDVLKVYSATIKNTFKSTETESRQLLDGWEELSQLRNEVAHGALDYLALWESVLARLLRHLSKTRQLISLVETVVEKPYTGSQ